MFKIFLFLTSTLALSSAKCPVGTIQGLGDRDCYWINTIGVNSPGAEQVCNGKNGSLVSITNAFTNQFFAGLTDSLYPYTFEQFWTGATRLNSTNWQWTDGSVWNYVNWAPGQPMANATCATLQATTGLWYGTSCYTAQSSICKVPSMAEPLPPKCCPEGFSYFEDTCYRTIVGENFTTSLETCRNWALGADLVSIHNEAKNTLVYYICSDLGNYVWLGLHDPMHNHNWQWSDGSALDYQKWNPSQNPNTTMKYCSYMDARFGQGQDNQWLTQDCSSTDLIGLCEVPPLN